jgi:hypothetical protein
MRFRLVVLVLAAAVMLAGCKAAETAAGLPKGSLVVEAEDFAKLENATVKPYPAASGGKAVLLDKYNSKIETTVTLEAGKYEVVVVALAKDSENDALEVKLTAPELGVTMYAERVFFDEAYDEFVAASAVLTVSPTKKGDVKVTVQAAYDEWGSAVDRVELRKVVE